MTPEQIAERGRRAAELLNNSLLNEVFESILTEVSRQWLVTPRESSIDRDKREELHARAAAISELRAELTKRVNDAKVTADRMQRSERRSKEK